VNQLVTLHVAQAHRQPVTNGLQLRCAQGWAPPAFQPHKTLAPACVHTAAGAFLVLADKLRDPNARTAPKGVRAIGTCGVNETDAADLGLVTRAPSRSERQHDCVVNTA
jgi:hypothetical protein